METFPTLSDTGRQLAADLQAAKQDAPVGDKFQVTGIGAGIYKAYEKIRNAAEYGEQHLLLRAAIERFLRRMALVQAKEQIGAELVTDLTQAGYLPEDSVPVATVALIDTYVQQYAGLGKLLETTPDLPGKTARRWVMQVLSSSIEKLLSPDTRQDVFAECAHRHYLGAIDRQQFAGADEQQFEACLYLAIHRSLLKSDIAAARYHVVARGIREGFTAPAFISLCRMVDEQFQSKPTNQLVRLLNRCGAPMRILHELVVADSINLPALLPNSAHVLEAVRSVADQQYTAAHKRLVGGVMRALAFIVISKVLIGLAIEVPYDLAQAGKIAVLPLAVNLLFPALYMVSARWELVRPGMRNTEVIADHIGRTLYQTDHPLHYRLPGRAGGRSQRLVFDITYALLFFVSFGVAVWVLSLLHFEPVHMVIFFIFFSAVSFLRFRLLQTARELEMVDPRQRFIATLADLFYTPFVRLGMWLSDKYQRINIVTVLLDYAIELPLKSSLRLLSQWVSFLRDKREEL